MNFLSNLAGKFFSNESNNKTPTQCPQLETNITVNQNTQNPTKAWEILKVKVKHEKVDPLPLDYPKQENKIRFVCISDTHGLANRLEDKLPEGDVLIHAGDFSNAGLPDEVEEFSNFLKRIESKFAYKVVIAGNHELSFDSNVTNSYARRNFLKSTSDDSKLDKDPREFLKNCIYLEDSMVELFGIKIYGSPWQPRYGDWAFNVDRGENILKIWNKIPNETDVLITHGPPLGFGDKTYDGVNAGCCELLSTIRDRVKPKYHIFGHIHESYGHWTDGTTNYINASTCNLRYKPINPPVIFDIDKPKEKKENE